MITCRGQCTEKSMKEVAGDCSKKTGTQTPKLREGCNTNLGTECDFTATYEIRITRLPYQSRWTGASYWGWRGELPIYLP